jgi:hypothetical protein
MALYPRSLEPHRNIWTLGVGLPHPSHFASGMVSCPDYGLPRVYFDQTRLLLDRPTVRKDENRSGSPTAPKLVGAIADDTRDIATSVLNNVEVSRCI